MHDVVAILRVKSSRRDKCRLMGLTNAWPDAAILLIKKYSKIFVCKNKKHYGMLMLKNKNRVPPRS